MPHSVCKVLLVEDSDDYALVMTRGIHRGTGLQLLWHARDGLEAIKYLSGTGDYGNREKFPLPDLMLLDVQMPRKDGWDVLEWLQDQPVRPVVVVVTILDNPTSRKKALALGADEFQIKPYDEDGLKAFLVWVKDLCTQKR